MEFIINAYIFEHGKRPGGVGGWAFSLHKNPQPAQIFWVRGTYAEAKKQARAHFASARPFAIYVQP